MSKIYHAVPEIAHSNLLDNQTALVVPTPNVTVAWLSKLTTVVIMTPRARVTSSHVRDVARDVTDVRQIGIDVLSMANFEFLKSDQ